MEKQDLSVGIVQQQVQQMHNIDANLADLEERLADFPAGLDLIVLPEMFNTGYTVDPVWAEVANLQTHKWMKQMAGRTGALIVGSLMFREGERVTNRMIGQLPDGTWWHYDKKHLFSFAGEHERLAPGQQQAVWHYKGWAIRPVVCYDLRFPEWLRRTATTEADLYLIAANWPQSRQTAWDTLLRARAIENQAFVIGVNRAVDPPQTQQKLVYGGGSAIINPEGTYLAQCDNQPQNTTATLSAGFIDAFRQQFPFWRDSDGFKKVG